MHKEEKISLSSAGLRNLIENCNQNALQNPAEEWQRGFARFFKAICVNRIGVNIPNYTICLTGLTTVGLGTPFSTVDTFVITDTPLDANRYRSIFSQIEEDISTVSLGSNPHHLPVNKEIRLSILCLTKEEFLEKITVAQNSELYIQAILNAVVIIGSPKRLFDLQDELKPLLVTSGDKSYADVASFLHGIVAYHDDNFENPFTNISHDIIRPVLATINGLSMEHKGCHLVDPRLIVRDLMTRGKMSLLEVEFLLAILDKISRLKWETDSKAGKNENVTRISLDLQALPKAIANIRTAVKQRLSVQDNIVRTNVDTRFTIVPTVKTDDIFNISEAALKVFSPPNINTSAGENNKEVVFQTQKFSINSTLFKLVERFDDLPINVLMNQYVKLIFSAIKDNILNQDQFKKWMAVMVRRCAHELVDTDGNLMPWVKTLLSKDNLYNSLPHSGKPEKINQIIVEAYFINIILRTLSADKKLADIASKTMNPKHPELSITFDILNTADKYFREIYENPNCLIHVQKDNYHGVLMILYPALNKLKEQIETALSTKKKLKTIERDLFTKYLGSTDKKNTCSGIVELLKNSFEGNHNFTAFANDFHQFMDSIVSFIDNFKQEAMQIKDLKDSAKQAKFVKTPEMFKVESRISQVCKLIIAVEDALFSKDIKVPNPQPSNGPH